MYPIGPTIYFKYTDLYTDFMNKGLNVYTRKY